MMNDPIETITLDDGRTIEIWHDADCESPIVDDEAVRIVILHRRYSDPSEGACGSTPDDVARWVRENSREWYVTNLYMYEHSAVALRAGESNPFGDPWDSGQVGVVALKKSEWGRGKGERNAKRLQWAKDVAEAYGRWMNGECYGYIIRAEDGEEEDSCWGFIGYEHVEAEAKSAAKG